MAATTERLRFLESAGRWSLYEVVSGDRVGALVAGPPGLAIGRGFKDPRFHDLDARARREADGRAESLLRSLLTPVQQAERAAPGGRFWVDTPRGQVQLGVKYDIRHVPPGLPARVRSLCVVPTGWEHGRPIVPDADFWANLVLMLAADPDEFFAVAIVRSEDLARHPACAKCASLMQRRRGESWSCHQHGPQPDVGRRWVG